MTLYVLLLLFMTLTASFASFFLKKSTKNRTIISIITNKYLYVGGILYAIAVLFNIWLLKKMPFSVVVPLGSICYIWTMVIAGIFLKERIGIWKILGLLLILSGVICVTQ